jgi:hypothetical protein
MVQYIEHIFQQFVPVKLFVVNRCVGKKWLFWFCEGSAFVSGKTKCAICAVAFLSVSFLSAVRSNRLAPNSLIGLVFYPLYTVFCCIGLVLFPFFAWWRGSWGWLAQDIFLRLLC